jgi:F-type H+-transporting ATPase subunit delta
LISNISKRYARAFFEIAEEEKKLEQYYNELCEFSSIVKGNKDLEGFLANPIFEQDVKKKVLEKIIGKLALSPMTINFLKLLTDKNRIDVLPDIETCYRLLMDETLRKVRVTLKTAFPLSGDMQKYIIENLKKMTGQEIEVTMEDDKSLLGGIVIGVGDTLYDGSIKNQLNNMRNLLGEAR